MDTVYTANQIKRQLKRISHPTPDVLLDIASSIAKIQSNDLDAILVLSVHKIVPNAEPYIIRALVTVINSLIEIRASKSDDTQLYELLNELQASTECPKI